MPASVNGYIGRFAPTPSGHLHFGSLLAALASYLDARQNNGQWLLRIEDLDTPRNQPGADQHILQTLDAFGLHWDNTVIWQSQRLEQYQAVLDDWLQRDLAFFCDCSRQDLKAFAGVYPGTCRQRQLAPDPGHAIRVRVDDRLISATDRLQQTLQVRLSTDPGDFVVRRRDGIIAYQLAVVIDDVAQGITDIVRGADLLDSTPRQIWLYHLLKAPVPRYLHIPLLLQADGDKLSKRLGATPIAADQAPATLFRALHTLAQQPPAELARAPISELLDWAIANWQPQHLPAAPQFNEMYTTRR
ncbi:tRNA glutamyl-Q(34) synthetase GluQRS [Halopseudomonas salegens]|uniref:Glutamyl-Q tRNA(Asp) synthetase n=1 Tax=Halopseudomonas salegens TaxID=1434072 RepID=A0A1H2DVZ8_9GAMM|nr:tRNA glutamyl-Q(34) synthetase GluQRS [Halopseudomonas salegens]SDT86974.1 glutamyl-Q tRNA(Asp) synthetase [Halopseudomonas salegens]